MGAVSYSLLFPVLVAAATSILLLFLFRINSKLTLFALFCFLVSGLLTLAYISADLFSGRGIDDSVAFHVLYVIDWRVLYQFRWLVLLVLLSLMLLAGVAYLAACYSVDLLDKGGSPGVLRMLSLFVAVLVVVLSIFSVVLHPAVIDIYKLSSDYISAKKYTDSSPPPIVTDPVVAVNPKSFVYIYVESLESLFFDNAKYPGLMRNLEPILKSGAHLQNIYQAPHTGWTMAGMVASQCGLPLATFGDRDNTAKNDTAFLPQAVCMGDILSAAGYDLTYMGGADLHFAGKGSFYRTHGFNQVLGRDELQTLHGGGLRESEWGIYDDRFLDIAFCIFRPIVNTYSGST